jgi:hypothetical protein
MEQDLAHDGFLASLAPPSATRPVLGTHPGYVDARGEGLVDALSEERAGAVALVRDSDRYEENEDEGG